METLPGVLFGLLVDERRLLGCVACEERRGEEEAGGYRVDKTTHVVQRGRG
jgi:hypothetical protein